MNIGNLQESPTPYHMLMKSRAVLIQQFSRRLVSVVAMVLLASACSDGQTDSGTDPDSDTEMGTEPDTDEDTETWGPCGVNTPDDCHIEDGVCVMNVPSGWEPVASEVLTPEDYGAHLSLPGASLGPTGAGGVFTCGDGIHFGVIGANSAAIIPPGQHPQPVSSLESESGEPSIVRLTVRTIETGVFVGMVDWHADTLFTPECPYWWFGSVAADACIDVALDLIRPIHPLCPQSNANLPPSAGCPCGFNLLTDDVNPQCEDTDGDGYWETPAESR